MTTVYCSSIADFRKKFAADMKAFEARLDRALIITLYRAMPIVRARMPVAFHELEQSLHVEAGKRHHRLIADSNHAQATEEGAGPHWPPLEPLIRWVKLRGAQGLLGARALKRQPGIDTFRHARATAAAMRQQEQHGAVSVDAPEQIARDIQAKIAKVGTRPHWWMKLSLPDVCSILEEEVAAALPR